MKNGSHLPPEVTAEKGDDHNLLFILKNVCTKGGERFATRSAADRRGIRGIRSTEISKMSQK